MNMKIQWNANISAHKVFLSQAHSFACHLRLPSHRKAELCCGERNHIEPKIFITQLFTEKHLLPYTTDSSESASYRECR